MKKNLCGKIAIALLISGLLTGCSGDLGSGSGALSGGQKTADAGQGADRKTWSYNSDDDTWDAGSAADSSWDQNSDDSEWDLGSVDLSEDWTGDDAEDVAAYLVEYERLPDNYMTKKEASRYGWEGGALHLTVPGKCIGGDYFGNYDSLLPPYKDYQECDIDTLDQRSRGAERIIYSIEDDDIDIWYTDDHYESFELVYGDGA